MPVDVGNLVMKHGNKFLIRRFQNRNGASSYRAEGRLCGLRLRRNFETQEEAAAEKVVLELQALQSASNLPSKFRFCAAESSCHVIIHFPTADNATRASISGAYGFCAQENGELRAGFF